MSILKNRSMMLVLLGETWLDVSHHLQQWHLLSVIGFIWSLMSCHLKLVPFPHSHFCSWMWGLEKLWEFSLIIQVPLWSLTCLFLCREPAGSLFFLVLAQGSWVFSQWKCLGRKGLREECTVCMHLNTGCCGWPVLWVFGHPVLQVRCSQTVDWPIPLLA